MTALCGDSDLQAIGEAACSIQARTVSYEVFFNVFLEPLDEEIFPCVVKVCINNLEKDLEGWTARKNGCELYRKPAGELREFPVYHVSPATLIIYGGGYCEKYAWRLWIEGQFLGTSTRAQCKDINKNCFWILIIVH